MKTNPELVKQLMQMKKTIQQLKSFCHKHSDHSITNERRALRLEIMSRYTDYFIAMVTERKE